jgi:hypothetical protein
MVENATSILHCYAAISHTLKPNKFGNCNIRDPLYLNLWSMKGVQIKHPFTVEKFNVL